MVNMNKEQLLILREIVWQLNKHNPKVLTKILENMDIKTEALDEVMAQIDKEIA